MAPYDPNRHHRRSIRLKGYDYTQPGAYFLTLCTHERAHLFGRVVDGNMVLNEWGEIARQCWLAIPDHFPHTRLDEFVIMPNHVHGIVWILDDMTMVEAKNISPLPMGAKDISPLPMGAKNISPLPMSDERPCGTYKTIGSIVRGFKIGVTKWARQHTDLYTVWQRNYFDHIIRTEHALHAIRQNINDNPLRWHLDRFNPDASAPDPMAGDIWRMMDDHKDEQ